MTFPFDPAAGVVVVAGKLLGPIDTVELRLLIDTGADMTVINPGSLTAAGYDPTKTLSQFGVTTAGAMGTSTGLFRVDRLTALGLGRDNLPLLCYALPATVDIDGLLGLDFFEGHVLTIDFVNHTVALT